MLEGTNLSKVRGPVASMNRFDETIEGLRKEKDHFFRTDGDSPIPIEQRASFTGLNYYPPDNEFRVSAWLSRFDKPEPFCLATSTGTSQTYLKYGRVDFEIRGMRLHLFVYKSAEDPFAMSLFIPFLDETSGSETYSSGRYVDLEENGGDQYELDFNKAYNPYCGYNNTYACPVPPRENILPVRISAGEKGYK